MNTTSKLKRVVITAGGTGGHVFPALAFAKALQAEGIEVCWLGTARGIESKIAPKHRIPLHLIHVLPWRGKRIWDRLKAPIALWEAFNQTRQLLRVFKPDVLVGFGGFVSAPGGLAAWWMGVPVVIHEQNSIAGLTNRCLRYISRLCLQAFPNAFSKPNDFIKTVGNPLRSDFLTIPPPNERQPEHAMSKPFQILVLGGSLGALKLNEVVPEAVSQLTDSSIRIIHQTGEKTIQEAQACYDRFGFSPHQYELNSFIDNMTAAYLSADLVICRAGALTVSELCAVGVPAIFIPYPHSADDHQIKNAEYLVISGAAYMLLQSECTPKKLAGMIQELIGNASLRARMANNAYELRHRDVLKNMIRFCEEVVR